MRKPLTVILINFTKAYDSIRRGKLIKLLISNRMNQKIINIIAGVYVLGKDKGAQHQ